MVVAITAPALVVGAAVGVVVSEAWPASVMTQLCHAAARLQLHEDSTVDNIALVYHELPYVC